MNDRYSYRGSVAMKQYDETHLLRPWHLNEIIELHSLDSVRPRERKVEYYRFNLHC